MRSQEVCSGSSGISEVGERGSVSWRSSPLDPTETERGASPEVARLIGAVQDTTERKRAEDALQATQSELARVTQLSMMGQMAAAIAHEINQPLAAIVANGSAGLRWLAGTSPNLEEGSAALKRIVGEGHRAASVIAGIRAMFKKDHQEKAVLAVNPLIGELLTLALFPAMTIAVRKEGLSPLVWVLAVTQTMSQAGLSMSYGTLSTHGHLVRGSC